MQWSNLQAWCLYVLIWNEVNPPSPLILPFAAMKPQEVQEKLGLFRMRDRNWYVQPACATTGDGLYEGLTWLTSNHKS